MAVSRLHHVAVVVHDADRALRFYRDTLGLPVTEDAVNDEQGVRGVLLDTGDGEVELIQPTRPDTGVSRFLQAQGEGLHHLCLETADIAAELQTAKARGMQLIDETPRRGLAGWVGFVHPRSNHGVLVEYVQPFDGQAASHRGAVGLAPGRAFQIQAVDHVVVAVRDLPSAITSFTAHFDLPVNEPPAPAPAFGLELAALGIGAGFIALATPIGEDPHNFLHRRLQKGEGLVLLSLAVDNLNVAVADLRAAGIKVTDPVRIGHAAEAGRLAVSVAREHAHGVRLQIIQAK